MADKITWYLGADASQVRTEMTAAVSAVSAGTGKMVHDIDGVTTSHNNLLRSDHRVAAALRGFASNAISTGDAVGSLSSAMQTLAMATNVSLPALIGLEVISTLIQKIWTAYSEAVKLNKELDDAAKPRDPKSSVPIAEDIKAREEIAAKGQKDIEGKKAPGFFQRVWKGLTTPNEEGPSQDRFKDFDRSKLQRGEAGEEAAKKMVSYQADDLELKQRQVDAVKATTAALKEQEKAEEHLKNLTENVAKNKIEKLQFSLADLAKEGRNTSAGDDSRPGAGKLARQAMKEEALAKKEMLAEHYPEAFQHQARADSIKNSIVPLKDGEKDTLNALDRSQLLQQIAKNTAQRLVNR